MTQRTHRYIDLESPLEVYDVAGIVSPCATHYRVFALKVDASGRVEALARDTVGRPVVDPARTQSLAREAVRVLGLESAVSLQPRKPRRDTRSDLIPQVWGLTLRGVGSKGFLAQAS